MERGTVEKINFYLVNFFAEVQKSNELSSAKLFANYLCSLRCAPFAHFTIRNRYYESISFHDPKSGLYHVVGNICKELRKLQDKAVKAIMF